MTQKIIYLEKSFEVEIPVQALWKAITNTARLNRAAGYSQVVYKPDPAGVRVDTKLLGKKLRILERPYNWIRYQYTGVERYLDNGPVARTRGGVKLQAAGARTLVTLWSEIEPRTAFGAFIGPYLFKKRNSVRQERIYRQLELQYKEQKAVALPAPNDLEINNARLQQTLERLRQNTTLAPAHIDQLENFIQTAPDDELNRLRPYLWADRFNLDRKGVVSLFLQATKFGIFDMAWSLLCPNCRVSNSQNSFTRLANLPKIGHCPTCQIDYDADFNQFVELRFTINPQIRPVYNEQFCITGPFMTPHILAQLMLKPGESREFTLELEPGFYRLRSRPDLGGQKIMILPPVGQAEQNAEVYNHEVIFQEAANFADELEITASQINFKLTNRTTREVLFIFEQGAWGQQGLSAAEVTTFQDFRDLYSSEILAPGIGVEIRNMTFLFSDLKDSTALYERTGDSTAYALVRDHFGIMGEAISQNQGGIVKTIGDAVMAVFVNPAAAVQACLKIQKEIAEMNRAQPDREPLIVKLGVHSGACIAITANEILDYFGSTVNTAARVQGVSTGGDLVLTQEVYSSPGVKELLKDIACEQFEMKLKGLSQNFMLYRFWPTAEVTMPPNAQNHAAPV